MGLKSDVPRASQKSQAPAVAVTLAVVLLIAYVGIMAYVGSTLVNFSNQ